VLRRWLLILTLPLLLLAVCLLRSQRFERAENEMSVGMAELKAALPVPPDGALWEEGKDGPVLRVTARAANARNAISFRLPVSAPVHALHIALDIASKNIVRGQREWEDGRIMVRWLPEGGKGPADVDAVASTRGSENKQGGSLVVLCSYGAGYPVLVIENLAASGDLIVSGMEITPVKHRAAWHPMRWILAAGWLAWLVAFLSGSPRIALPRRYAAASLWLVMGAYFAFPGPWERLYPMIIGYDLGAETGKAHPAPDRTAPDWEAKTPQGLVGDGAHGKIPDQRGWIIRLRQHLKNQRLLLHTGFVVGMIVLFSCLVGARRASWLAAGMVLAIEGSQVGFGYGFDNDDIRDLICGAIGIVLGRLLFGKLCGWGAFSRWVALPPAQLASPAVPNGFPDERKPAAAVDP
jgi:hypothetical protein